MVPWCSRRPGRTSASHDPPVAGHFAENFVGHPLRREFPSDAHAAQTQAPLQWRAFQAQTRSTPDFGGVGLWAEDVPDAGAHGVDQEGRLDVADQHQAEEEDEGDDFP